MSSLRPRASLAITFPVAGQAGTLVRLVLNNSGSTIAKGSVVYINGASGNKPTIAKAIATGDSTSAQTFGLVQADITNNSSGYVVVSGDLIGLNTSGITEGTQLYLSSTTAGEYTTTKQLAPAHLVYVGVVTRSHASLGQIEVKIQNGYELDELHDVAISSKTNKDFLTYESSSDLWKNKSLGTIIGGTSSQFIKGNGSLDSNTYALDSVVVKLTGNQSISGKKSFNLVQTGYNLSLITSDIFSDGTIESNNGMLRLVNNTTSADLFRLESDGIVFAKAFKKDGGTSSEFLMADGSVSTGGGLSGTTNYIPKFTSSSSIGNSLIYDNGTAVGIGVVPETWGSATKALQLGLYASLYDSSGSTILGFNTYNNGTSNKYIATGSLAMRYIINGSGHIWETAPTGTADANITYTERMRITSDGNVGIGNAPTIGRLFVKGIDGQANNTITISSSDFVQGGDGSILTIGHNASSGSSTAVFRNIILGGTTYGDIAFPFGNVGIGTPTPTAKLHVTGGSSANNTIFATTSVYANGSYGSLLRLGHVSTSGNTTAIIQNLTVGGTTEGDISFPQGNVGIGTTSPTVNLHIASSAAEFLLDSTGANQAFIQLRTTHASPNNNNWTIAAGRDNIRKFSIVDNLSGERFTISTSGAVKVFNLGTGTVYSNAGTLTNTNPSDERLKENITDLGYGLNEILQLRPVSYSWINDTANQGKQFGFIAQEVQEIMPDLISEFETKDGEEDVVRLGLDKEAIFVAMVNAIKEQNEVLEQLKAEIELLKAK